jgi:hypothetical protein
MPRYTHAPIAIGRIQSLKLYPLILGPLLADWLSCSRFINLLQWVN